MSEGHHLIVLTMYQDYRDLARIHLCGCAGIEEKSCLDGDLPGVGNPMVKIENRGEADHQVDRCPTSGRGPHAHIATGGMPDNGDLLGAETQLMDEVEGGEHVVAGCRPATTLSDATML